MNSSEPQRIYLDNAATSFPKPDSVIAAVTQYMTQSGVAAGRGTSRQATELDARIATCRAGLARLLGAQSPHEISFAFNGTDSLNLAIHGSLQPGDHVVTTELEHNSVLRPLRDWEAHRGVQVTHLAPGVDGRIDPAAVRDALRPNTRLVAVTHASNVTGVIQPIREIGELIARSRTLTPSRSPGGRGEQETRGVLYLVDAAQTAGHVPIDVQAAHIDLLCCSGHKGLLGPLGTGVTYIRSSRASEVRPLRQGGTGSQSESLDQPASSPNKFESGNPNAVGLVGLAAAVEWIEAQGVAALQARAQPLLALLYEGLSANPRVRVLSPDPRKVDNVGVISFTIETMDPRITASIMDSHFGIEIRSGLHCAPLIHRSLGTADTGGTARASVGPFTTEADVDALCTAVLMITTAT